ACDVDVASPLLGAHNAENLLTARANALLLDRDPRQAGAALSPDVLVPGRLERCHAPTRGDYAVVLVDYAHTPDSLTRALASVRPHTTGGVWCVFGCGGDRDAGTRRRMGAAVAEGADVAIVTNDNPRSEAPRAIADQVRAGMGAARDVLVELDRRAAIA